MSMNPIIYSDDSEQPKLIHWWNYSNPEKEGFSLELVGTVVAIQEYQQTDYNPDPNAPRRYSFWPDGHPKMGIRMLLVNEHGSFYAFAFSPASRQAKQGKRKSIHIDLFALTGNTDMKNLIGMTIKLSTIAPPQGFGYGAGNPRPWSVEKIDGAEPYIPLNPIPEEWLVDRLLPNESAHGGQVQQPQQQPAPQPAQQQPQYQQPMPPQYQQQYQPAQQPMPPQYQQPPVAPQYQPMQQPAQPRYQQPQYPQPDPVYGSMPWEA